MRPGPAFDGVIPRRLGTFDRAVNRDQLIPDQVSVAVLREQPELVQLGFQHIDTVTEFVDFLH